MAAKQLHGPGDDLTYAAVAQASQRGLQETQEQTTTAQESHEAQNSLNSSPIRPQVNNTSSQRTDTSQNLISFSRMELAYRELQDTLEQAQKYVEAGQLHPRHLKLHIDSLREDADNLATHTPDTEENGITVAELLMASRRTRRQLERSLIDLQIQEAEKTPSTISDAGSTRSRTSALKFAPIQLPTFDGNTTQFPVYRSFFEENILNNAEITETGRWLRLKESLKGQPAELISEIPHSAESLKVAWKLLTDTYGGNERPVVELYSKLQALPQASMSTERLRITYGKLEGLIMSLEQLKQEVDTNHFIRWTYMGKFPAEIMYQIQNVATTPFKIIRRTIGDIIAARECTDQQRAAANTRPDWTRRLPLQQNKTEAPTAQSSMKKLTAPVKALKCTFCEGQHWNDECKTYADITSRVQKLQGKCLKCLRNAHNTPCVGGDRRCYHCDSIDHNRALCPIKFTQTAATNSAQLAIIQQQPHKQHVFGHFLTFIAEAKSEFTEEIMPLRIIVDTAGGKTLLTEAAAKTLKIPVDKTKITQYIGLNDVQLTTSNALQGKVHLITPNGQTIQIQAEMIHGAIPEVQKDSEAEATCADYYVAPSGNGKPIDLLIGNDTIIDILKPEKINIVNANTLLLPTHFGYLIVGRGRGLANTVCPSMLIKFNVNPLQYLADIDLVGFTGIDESDVEEEERAIQQFYQTVQFINNRYSISWPWRTYPPQLDTNYGLALGRLKSLQKRLLRTPDLLRSYDEIIQNQLQEEIIELVDPKETKSAIVHYLPHHPILQPEKTTSIRPVIDASSKASHKSKSLNDNIRKGTKWLNDLVLTLLRFRKSKNVVVADIARAFHQIEINETDRDAARFLWLRNPTAAPTTTNLLTLRFRRVAFGIVASPFLLHAVIKHHANQQPDNDFLKIILQDMYADNLVSALNDEIDPNKFYTYAKRFFASMSMNLTKWATNIPTLYEKIPEEDQQAGNTQSILGIHWNMERDVLQLKQPKPHPNTETTPRNIAQKMASYFDPLGWAAPVVLQAKILFRVAWEQTKQWDSRTSDEISSAWYQIQEDLQQIKTIELPRQITTLAKNRTNQIHAFVDASKEAYAVAVYLRTQNETSVEINLIMAKTRLTPKKQITIPKLELIAMILGCKLINFIKTALKYDDNTESFIWSDSKCAISWMQQNKILPPILERYINEAKKYGVVNVKYVPSDQNYADIASRGGSVATLNKINWWKGPTWLREQNQWPSQNIDQPETNVQMLFQTQVTTKAEQVQENEINGIAGLQIQDFSSLTKLLQRTAYVFRATTKILKNNFLHLQTEIDVQKALQYWIRWDQSRIYALKNELNAGKIFHLRNIAVFRDADSIIRCQTRIANSCFHLETINPILLVQKSTLTKLLILDAHERALHAGTSYTLAQIRKKYWLPKGRREIYKVIHQDCFVCRNQTKLSYATPPPAPLPEFRVTRTNAPFQAIGLDICGPFLTRKILGFKQPKEKRWVMLFTCATIRAIHLEVLYDMTTDEILLAFRKFMARRGVPKIIISDNAPQFHLLDGCFKNIWKETAKTNTISNYMASHRITWTFIPENAPWMGGMYERLIQSVKLSFQRTYGDTIMLDRQFEASVIEIEGVLNARPISYVDREPDSPIVTPNDFLAAKFISVPMNTAPEAKDDNITRMWKESQNYLDKFWKDWADHYLLILRDRNDQLDPNRRTTKFSPQKGDIVAMIDHTKKRSAWRTAVVERRITGKDGEIRALQIKLPEGARLIRPVVALAPLQLKMDLPTIQDQQLSKDRRAITLWPPEGASQSNQNSERSEEGREQRGDTAKGKRGSGGDGACPTA